MVHSVVSLRLRFMGLASGMVSPCIASVAILVIRKLMLKTDRVWIINLTFDLQNDQGTMLW